MAKLYWRVKKEGKWTWIPATNENTVLVNSYRVTEAILDLEEEE